MVTSLNGNIFRATGPLWRESGHRLIPLAKASDAELFCFLWSMPEQTVEQIIETLVIRAHYDVTVMKRFHSTLVFIGEYCLIASTSTRTSFKVLLHVLVFVGCIIPLPWRHRRGLGSGSWLLMLLLTMGECCIHFIARRRLEENDFSWAEVLRGPNLQPVTRVVREVAQYWSNLQRRKHAHVNLFFWYDTARSRYNTVIFIQIVTMRTP